MRLIDANNVGGIMKNRDEPIKVYGPSNVKFYYYIISGILILLPSLAGFILVLFKMSIDLIIPIIIVSMIILFLLNSLNNAIRNRISGLPKIVIYQTGIKLKSRKSENFYRWKDLGPFNVWIRTTRIFDIVYLEIRTNAEFEVNYIKYKIDEIDSSMKYLRFEVSDLEAGSSSKKANNLVKELNDWRHKFNNAAEDVIKIENAKIEEIEKVKTKHKKKLSRILLIILIAYFIMLFYYIYTLKYN